jgi:hypothetical protein
MINFQFCQNCHRVYQDSDATICCGRATSLHFACSSEEEYESLLPSAEMAEMVTISWPCGVPTAFSDSDRVWHSQPLWYALDHAISHPIEVAHADGRRYTILPATGVTYASGEAWQIPAHHPALGASAQIEA